MAGRGRPREFALDETLDAAVEVFWRQGYEGTTLDDLTTAMGINRPSLYAAFGNKESLFRQALDRYAAVDMAYVGEALAEPTAAGVVEHYLRSNVLAITQPGKPTGCLSIQGAIAAPAADQSIVDFVTESRAGGERRIAERLRTAADLPEDENPDDLATFVCTVSAGLAVQAAAGVPRATLMRVVERTLRGLQLAS